jgi:hypothetical protein
MTAPETMSVVAAANIYLSDYRGYVTDSYYTTSPISTTVASPTASGMTHWVYADAIHVVVPSAWATPTATTTPNATSNEPPSPGFHLGPLNFTFSIVVIVAGGVIALIVLCFCYRICARTCCRPNPGPWQGGRRPDLNSRSKPRAKLRRKPRQGPRPPSLLEILSRSVSEVESEPAVRPPCLHGLGSSCRSSAKGCCCCVGGDKRPPPMTREERVSTYCFFCQLIWTRMPAVMCPKEWELLCEHMMSCESDLEKPCCACCDKRSKLMDLDIRVKDYCPPCRRKWEIKPPIEWPWLWARPVQILKRKPVPSPNSPKTTLQNGEGKGKGKKDIEMTQISPKSAERGPEAQILGVDDGEGKSYEDKGPQYGEPQFFSENSSTPHPVGRGDQGEHSQAIGSAKGAYVAIFPPFSGEAALHGPGPACAFTNYPQVPLDQPITIGIATTGMASPTTGPSASPASAGSSRSQRKYRY